jgi:ubiquitin-conjugating enzyme E2 Q
MDELNLPLVAFCYLSCRLTVCCVYLTQNWMMVSDNIHQLCTRYCLVCHNKLNADFEVLKPYVCDSKLCSYQFYAFNREPSLEVCISRSHFPLRLSDEIFNYVV